MIDNLITQAIKISKLSGYQGTFQALGGGEINDTYRLDFVGGSKILRIAKYVDQNSLHQEAHALQLVSFPEVPKLIFFDSESRIQDRLWIIESFLPGISVERLNLAQYNSLGALLAKIHKIPSGHIGVNIWSCFLDECKMFGNEYLLLNHPEPRVKHLITCFHSYIKEFQPQLDKLPSSLIHGDATPSNVLIEGESVSLIDWEFSKYKDPMAEFSTIYYDDMEYNQGKWRVHITPEERSALYEGYHSASGLIDENRVRLWMIFDKLGAAVFLYWRLHESGRTADELQRNQYQLDFENLIKSLITIDW
ncbi:MAG: hypothetical protein NVS1B7_0560 [Candidatus Saccharimonadales bacterium]